MGELTPQDTLVPPASAPSATVQELVLELALAPSGVGFIARCLDRLVELHGLRDAYAVIDDEVLGAQLFTAGREPLPKGVKVIDRLSRGAGIHTDPTLINQVDELEALARLCDIALRLDRLQYESLHDPLTGLYNRRGFDAQVQQAASGAERYGWNFALVLLDLDGFKAINDRFGHHRGDAVLRSVGARLRRDLRAGDIAARVGGDEFAVLLYLGDTGDAHPVLERLKAEPLALDIDATITWAAGVALCPEEATDLDGLLRLADTRLYETKGLQARERQG